MGAVMRKGTKIVAHEGTIFFTNADMGRDTVVLCSLGTHCHN
jgi:hypothetical protein